MMRRHTRLVSSVLLAALALALMAPLACAAPVPSQTTCTASVTLDEQAAAAEREIVKGRLMDFGLSEKDAGSRVSLLTDQEVHALATDLDAVRAGGANPDETAENLAYAHFVIVLVYAMIRS